MTSFQMQKLHTSTQRQKFHKQNQTSLKFQASQKNRLFSAKQRTHAVHVHNILRQKAGSFPFLGAGR